MEKKILMTPENILATVEGRKTTLRVIMKLQPLDDCSRIKVGHFYPTKIDKHGEEYPGDKIFGAYSEYGEWGCKCPWQIGGRLCIKERKKPAMYWLEITGIKAERLQDITPEDCIAEGIESHSWESNPWCWCISFKAVV